MITQVCEQVAASAALLDDGHHHTRQPHANTANPTMYSHFTGNQSDWQTLTGSGHALDEDTSAMDHEDDGDEVRTTRTASRKRPLPYDASHSKYRRMASPHRDMDGHQRPQRQAATPPPPPPQVGGLDQQLACMEVSSPAMAPNHLVPTASPFRRRILKPRSNLSSPQANPRKHGRDHEYEDEDRVSLTERLLSFPAVLERRSIAHPPHTTAAISPTTQTHRMAEIARDISSFIDKQYDCSWARDVHQVEHLLREKHAWAEWVSHHRQSVFQHSTWTQLAAKLSHWAFKVSHELLFQVHLYYEGDGCELLGRTLLCAVELAQLAEGVRGKPSFARSAYDHLHPGECQALLQQLITVLIHYCHEALRQLSVMKARVRVLEWVSRCRDVVSGVSWLMVALSAYRHDTSDPQHSLPTPHTPSSSSSSMQMFPCELPNELIELLSQACMQLLLTYLQHPTVQHAPHHPQHHQHLLAIAAGIQLGEQLSLLVGVLARRTALPFREYIDNRAFDMAPVWRRIFADETTMTQVCTRTRERVDVL